ncbi:MAG: thioesterase family protein [Candidatus Aminicenantaceae bacterium]
MPRVRLKQLDQYPFSTKIVVRVTDLNYGGHLGNDSLLSLVHEARVAFLDIHGFSELDCGGVSLTMGDAAIAYQGEAYAGDELIIEVAAGESSKSGFRLFYRLTRSSDAKKIALAETGMVCFDYKAKKIKPLPKAVKDICTSK